MKTVTQLSNILALTFGGLESNINEFSEAEALLLCAQTDLAQARCKALLTHDAADLGKNEQQRDARIMDMTAEERQTVRLAEARRHEARTRLDIARLRKEQVMAELRLLEVQARGLEGQARCLEGLVDLETAGL